MLRLLALLGIIKLVWLRTDWREWNSYSDNYYLTIKRKLPNGKYWANVYPYTMIGSVELRPDGTCVGESSYIKFWTDWQPKIRTKKSLRNMKYATV